VSKRGARPDPHLEQLWRQRLERWQRSGLSARAFCARERLRESAFYFWRRTLRDRDAHASPAFVPVTLTAAPAPPVEVVLAGGQVLRVPTGFDPATLRSLLAALEQEPC
jgi:transposase